MLMIPQLASQIINFYYQMDCISHNNRQIQYFTEALSALPNLSEAQKINLKNRFISLLQEYTDRANKYSITFEQFKKDDINLSKKETVKIGWIK
jgi:hypothetical protein